MTNHPCPVGVKIALLKVEKLKYDLVEIEDGDLIGNDSNNDEEIKAGGKVTIDFKNKALGILFNKFSLAITSKNLCYFSKEFDKKKYCIVGDVHFKGDLEIERYIEGQDNVIAETHVEETFEFAKYDGKKVNKDKCCSKTFEYSVGERIKEIDSLLWKGIITLRADNKINITVSCCQKKKKKKGKFLWNKRSGEIHDLKNIKGSCNIDRMNEENKVYLTSIKKGSNGCYHCLREYDTG